MTGRAAVPEASAGQVNGYPAEWGLMVLHEWRPPQSLTEAHALLAGAGILRARGQDTEREFLVRLANEQEASATRFMAYPSAELPPMGTGGELVPAERSEEVPGLCDTARHPNRTTAAASAERLKLAAEAHSLELAVDLAETVGARDLIEKEMAHQMAVTHRLHMRIAERVTPRVGPPATRPATAERDGGTCATGEHAMSAGGYLSAGHADVHEEAHR